MIPVLPPKSALETVLGRTISGFAIIDSDFRFQLVNQPMARITGRSIEEHLGRHASEILGEPHWSETLSRVFQRALAGEETRDLALPGIFPVAPGAGKGAVRQVYASCFGIQAAGRLRSVVLLARDVTDCLESEETNRESNTILDRMAEGFVCLDASWHYTYVNREAERLVRMRREDMLGKSVWELFPESIDSPFHAAAYRVQKSRQPETLEDTISILGFWLSIRLYPERNGGVSVYFQDVTDRYEAATAQREARHLQHDFMRDVLSSATGGRLTLCDSLTGIPSLLPETLAEDRVALTPVRGIRELRKAAERAADALQFSNSSWFDFETSIGEAAMNAVVHAGGGEGVVSRDSRRGTVQVRIADRGKGIAAEYLPRALLQQGFTTAGTMGQGFKMILQMVDRAWLFTDDEGTIVVLEKERS